MNLAHRGREKIRVQALKRHRVYEALHLLINNISTDNLHIFISSKKTISSINSRPKLAEWLRQINNAIKKLRQQYGVKLPDAELVAIATQIEAARGDAIYWMIKSAFSDMFAHPERILPNFDNLPAHTYIGIDPGKWRSRPGTIELYLLEAKIFEDFAALFNITKERFDNYKPRTDNKQTAKTFGAVYRATIAYSVFFVEAYLNGIAFDHYLINASKLDKEKMGLLLDWDFSKDRPRYLSLRDKAYKYPRLILGTDHSPLQESNTPELAIILGKAAKIRDLIAHPSAKRNPQKSDDVELEFFFEVDFRSLEEIVDAAVALVQKIETAIRGNTSRLVWLYNRGPDGRFPDSVFD